MNSKYAMTKEWFAVETIPYDNSITGETTELGEPQIGNDRISRDVTSFSEKIPICEEVVHFLETIKISKSSFFGS